MNITDGTRRRNAAQGPGPHAGLDALKSNLGPMSRLPTLPEAATRAMAIAKDPNSSLAQLARVIERDPALAAGVLKLANSPLYRTRYAVESLHGAVVKLGTRECQNLILAIGMRSLFRNVPRPRQLKCEALWKHSFLTGCVARRLGRALNLPYDGEEFACGLAHDLGRVLLGMAAPDRVDEVDPVDFDEGPELIGREREALGTDHCYFGAWFAHLNNLPSSLVNAVQFHHAPEEAEEHAPLVALVAAADHMANHYQRYRKVDGYAPETNHGWSVLEVHLIGGKVPRFADVAPRVLGEAVREGADGGGVAA